ncbi:MAG: rhodanese-like domain-containing protein [Acidobacteria bacterium]|nr:rhodanese-like domain-containing protein [Acidobacteriota bacterium]
MTIKRHLGEAATLVAAAALCALVANALARTERKLPLVGTYPNALKVPEMKAEPTPVAAPVDSGAQAPSEVPLKVNGGGVPAPAARATAAIPKATPAAPAATKLPLEESSLSRFPAHPDKPYVEISGDDAAWLVARGVLVVDARRKKDYEQGHVAGARNISPWEGDADAKITALVNEGRDGAIPVVIYCSGGDCEDSHMLATRIYGGGFNNLLVYRDGWPDWVKRGGKSATGPEPAP